VKSKITAIFAIVLALAWLFFLVVKRRRLSRMKSAANRGAPRSAVGLTLKNLKLARAQISTATFREFSQLLSFALKMYIRAAHRLPSAIVTTEEMINGLMADASNDWSVISLLSEVLKLTDSVKYSQRKLSISQQRGLYKKACKFVILSERFFRSRKR
jgi:hypothetical protein